MREISITLTVDDTFEQGCCHECPLSYEESSYDEDDGYDYWDCCVLGHTYDTCPLEVK